MIAKYLWIAAVPGEIEDIRAPWPEPTRWPQVAELIVLVLGALLLVVWLIAGRRRSLRPPLTPYQVAEIALAHLRNQLDQLTLDEFGAQLSGLLRHFLTGRFGLEAERLTTPELRRRLVESNLPDLPAIDLIGQLLELCDRWKFARYHDAVVNRQTMIEHAESIIRPSP